jgi:hypothetical protein
MMCKSYTAKIMKGENENLDAGKRLPAKQSRVTRVNRGTCGGDDCSRDGSRRGLSKTSTTTTVTVTTTTFHRRSSGSGVSARARVR